MDLQTSEFSSGNGLFPQSLRQSTIFNCAEKGCTSAQANDFLDLAARIQIENWETHPKIPDRQKLSSFEALTRAVR